MKTQARWHNAVWLTMGLLVLLVAGPVSRAQPPTGGSQLAPDEVMCIMCHGEKELWEGPTAHLFIDRAKVEGDVHFRAGVNCHDCHGGDPKTTQLREAHAIESGFRKPLEKIQEACQHCHKDQWIEVRRKSVHAKAVEQSRPLQCKQCHGTIAHQLLPHDDRRSPVFIDNQVKTCGECHEEHFEQYKRSVHGFGLYEAGLASTAACADCHGAHGIYYAADKRSTLHPANVADTCGKCHRFVAERLRKSVHGGSEGPGGATAGAAPGGKIKRHPSCTDCHQRHDLKEPRSTPFRVQLPNRCGNCHFELESRYGMSLHGQLTELGYGPAAKCSDCHGFHDILPIDDPRGRLAGENRVHTCRRCHPYAVINFTRFDPHADHHDPVRYPALHRAYVAMQVLLLTVFGFFGVYTSCWFVRSLVHTVRHGRPHRVRAGEVALQRFRPVHRVFHVVLGVTFLGLALTGLPLKYSRTGWAQWLANAMGGFDSTRVLHHLCGVTMVIGFLVHLGWLARQVVRQRERGLGWRRIFFGPDSPVPNWRDVQDLARMIGWFVGLRRKPTFERWTYWEKFDYWAVFWGVAIIGTSGLVLWFPNLFTRFLPAGVLNLAKVIHSEEALLATGFIFAIHFFNTHLRPDKAPLDLSLLLGLVSVEELREERPDFLQRMEREGKLESMQVRAPSWKWMLMVRLAAYAALAVGLCLLAGMIYAGLAE